MKMEVKIELMKENFDYHLNQIAYFFQNFSIVGQINFNSLFSISLPK